MLAGPSLDVMRRNFHNLHHASKFLYLTCVEISAHGIKLDAAPKFGCNPPVTLSMMMVTWFFFQSGAQIYKPHCATAHSQLGRCNELTDRDVKLKKWRIGIRMNRKVRRWGKITHLTSAVPISQTQSLCKLHSHTGSCKVLNISYLICLDSQALVPSHKVIPHFDRKTLHSNPYQTALD